MKKIQIKKATLKNNEQVFAIQTLDGTFLADGVVHHNCEICNVALHGNINEYREKLTREIGEERVLALDRKKSQKISTPELEELLVEREKMLRGLGFSS